MAMLAAAAWLAACGGSTPPTSVTLEPGHHRVLFIGNSLTRSNDLPGTLSALAQLGGEQIDVESVVFGGYALVDHWYNGDARARIDAGGWEYVVLQQGPSSLDSNRANLIEWTQRFDALVRARGGRTALYMVWPDTVNFSSFARVGGSYLNAAEAVNGLFLPAGLAWLAAWEQDARLPLYGPDGFHPSPMGTFLAALVMYERITGKDPRALPAIAVAQGQPFELPESVIRTLQAAAHEANQWYQYPW